MENGNDITEEAESSRARYHSNQNDEDSGVSSVVGQHCPWKFSSRRLDPSKIHGFDGEVMFLTNILLRESAGDDGFKAIGVVGGSGVGKTTLCRVIFNRPEIKKRFLPRIWVSMAGAQPIEIVRSILTLLGVEDETISSIEHDHGLSGLVYAMHLQLVGKRYLIVLDDSTSVPTPWFEDLKSPINLDADWGGKLAYGLAKGHGGAVIVASRNEEMVEKMVGKENLQKVHPRSDSESCWLIFKDAAEESGVPFSPVHVDALKKEITRKTGGVPLAAKLLGQIMADKFRK